MTGSQISALDFDTGEIETISAKGGDIIAPDDIAFDSGGNLDATEVMDGRVSVRDTAAGPACCATTCRPPTGSPSTRADCSSASAAKAGD